jgi:hypothetical protein
MQLGATYGRTVTFQNEDGNDNDDNFSLDSYEPKPPDSFLIVRSRKMNPKVTLNIGGEFHDVMWATLEKIPKSRLGKLAFAQSHDEILVKTLVTVSLFIGSKNPCFLGSLRLIFSSG